jgi:hypothetical protein
LVADVVGQHGSHLEGEAVQDELDRLTFEDVSDILSRNVGNQLPTYAAQHSGMLRAHGINYCCGKNQLAQQGRQLLTKFHIYLSAASL